MKQIKNKEIKTNSKEEKTMKVNLAKANDQSLVVAEATETAALTAIENIINEVPENILKTATPEEIASAQAALDLVNKTEAEKPTESTPTPATDTKPTAPVAETKASESEKSQAIINSAIKKVPTLKIVESESKTGFSYFAGKKRLCKLLKTKRGIVLEINVPLTKAFTDLPEMENISVSMAYKKHLGTMKHLYRAADSKLISAIIKEAINTFKAEIDAKKQEEEKPAEKQETKAV